MGGKRTDMTGLRFERLVVLGPGEPYLSPGGSRKYQWKCRCDCGGSALVVTRALTTGNTKSCGCIQREFSRAESLIGQRFAKLTVVERRDSRTYPDGSTHAQWLCACDCGKTLTTSTGALRTGNTKSCGCIKDGQWRVRDLTGAKFGLLSVVAPAVGLSSSGKRRYHVRCECGTEFTTIGQAMASGNTSSCGCIRAAKNAAYWAEVHRVATLRRAVWAELYGKDYGKDAMSLNDLRKLRIEINGGVEPWTRAEIFERDCGLCHICQIPVGAEWDTDHIRPICIGGQDNPRNVAVAHISCNRSKPHDFYEGVLYCMICGPIGHPMSDHDND